MAYIDGKPEMWQAKRAFGLYVQYVDTAQKFTGHGAATIVNELVPDPRTSSRIWLARIVKVIRGRIRSCNRVNDLAKMTPVR